MTTTTCTTCQIEAKRNVGQELTNQERNHWMLWGCTCTDSTEAEAFITLVSQ